MTLTQQGRLRGCIGTLEANRSLGEDVVANAAGAALSDHRFAPLTTSELANVEVEVSVLSVPTIAPSRDERELLDVLRPGVDGVIVSYRDSRATYLPQVWEQLPDPRQFLASLVQKAGLPADTPLSRCTWSRYVVKKWRESELKVH